MRRRGWVVLEIIGSMFIMSALAGVLVVATHGDQRALSRLAESRALTRVAEAALIAMQAGQGPAGDANAGDRVAVKELSEPGDLPRMAWVEVTAGDAKRRSSLVGLVPRKAAVLWMGGKP